MKILNKNNILLSVKNYKKQTTSFHRKSYLMILICFFFFQTLFKNSMMLDHLHI